MPETVLGDLITPELLVDLTRVRLRNWLNTRSLGVVNVQNVGPGSLVEMRAFKQLSGDPDKMESDDPTSYAINEIGSEKDIAPIIHRIKNYGSRDIARIVSGMDADQAISAQVGDYWGRYTWRRMMALLGTHFSDSGCLYSDLCSDIFVDDATASNQKNLTPATAAKGMSLLGDEIEDMGRGIWICHSATLAYLIGAGYTSTDNAGAYGFDGMGSITTFMGRPIVANDYATTAAGTHVTEYYTYLVMPGSLSLGIQKDVNPEADRDTQNKMNYIATDFHFSVYAMGAKWNVTTVNPTDAALDTAGNWALLYSDRPQDVGICCVRHNVT